MTTYLYQKVNRLRWNLKNKQKCLQSSHIFHQVYGMVKFNKSQWKSRKSKCQDQREASFNTHTHTPCQTRVCYWYTMMCYYGSIYRKQEGCGKRNYNMQEKHKLAQVTRKELALPLPYPRGFKGGHMT